MTREDELKRQHIKSLVEVGWADSTYTEKKWKLIAVACLLFAIGVATHAYLF